MRVWWWRGRGRREGGGREGSSAVGGGLEGTTGPAPGGCGHYATIHSYTRVVTKNNQLIHCVSNILSQAFYVILTFWARLGVWA